MTTPAGQRCGTCKYAKWELSANGNRLRTVAGHCTHVITPPVLPACYEISLHKVRIWPDMGKDCPTWHAK